MLVLQTDTLLGMLLTCQLGGKNERHKAKACRNKINTTKTGMNCQLNGELEKYLGNMFTISHG